MERQKSKREDKRERERYQREEIKRKIDILTGCYPLVFELFMRARTENFNPKFHEDTWKCLGSLTVAASEKSIKIFRKFVEAPDDKKQSQYKQMHEAAREELDELRKELVNLGKQD